MRLVHKKIEAAAALLVVANKLRPRRPVMPGDRVRYHYYSTGDDGQSTARLVQGAGIVEFVRHREPSVFVEGHGRWLYRREVAHVGKAKT